jgi:hypothetical protein
MHIMSFVARTATIGAINQRIAAIDWKRVESELDLDGWAVLSGLLTESECDETAALYRPSPIFRSQVQMASHGFGRGEYRYFAYPLPPLVEVLRTATYPRLAPIANRWNERMGLPARFPGHHSEFLDRCHRAGQTRPTPLLLRYEAGDHNNLHQDLYGEHVFPLQLAVLLSAPGADFTGGELVLTEQRPRMQSRPMVVPLGKGDAALFAVHARPQHGSRGDYRVTMRHGVSKLWAGKRHTLGVIFHDAA